MKNCWKISFIAHNAQLSQPLEKRFSFISSPLVAINCSAFCSTYTCVQLMVWWIKMQRFYNIHNWLCRWDTKKRQKNFWNTEKCEEIKTCCVLCLRVDSSHGASLIIHSLHQACFCFRFRVKLCNLIRDYCYLYSLFDVNSKEERMLNRNVFDCIIK